MPSYDLSIDGWMSEAELQWLGEKAAQMSSIVEIGCWKGRSTYAFLANCTGPVYAIDHWKGSEGQAPEDFAEVQTSDIYAQFMANVGHFKNLFIRKCSSQTAASLGSVPTVDMVFIDAGHRYEDVVADIRAWKKKARVLLCGHDYNWDGVSDAIRDELGPVQEGPGALWYKYMNVEQQSTDKPRLIVCLPGSNFSGKWLAAWEELHVELLLRYRVTRVYGEGNNIYQVRADCVERLEKAARRDEPKHVLWIDSDNLVDYAGFRALAGSLEALPEASAVGAWYLMQMHYGEQPLVCAGNDQRRPTVEDIQIGAGRLLPVEYIGFGFLLMKYRMLEDLGLNCFTPILREDGDFETDDVSFCLNAGKKGHKFYLHSGVYSTHLKLQPVPVATRQQKLVAVQ